MKQAGAKYIIVICRVAQTAHGRAVVFKRTCKPITADYAKLLPGSSWFRTGTSDTSRFCFYEQRGSFSMTTILGKLNVVA